MTGTVRSMSAGRLCLIASFVLFLVAALLTLGLVKAEGNLVEALALLGFGLWALSGAV